MDKLLTSALTVKGTLYLVEVGLGNYLTQVWLGRLREDQSGHLVIHAPFQSFQKLPELNEQHSQHQHLLSVQEQPRVDHLLSEN
jgi:hypothetical protein